MNEPFPPPEPGGQHPGPPPEGPPGYGYQQQGYGYSYGPVSTYSGFWRRAAAFLLDELIIGVIGSLLAGISGDNNFVGILNLVLGVGYFSILEGTRGQTVGGMALNVRVIDADNGEIIGLRRAIVRNLVRIVSGLVFGLGYLWMLWDPRKQTWHDKAANTVVVRTA